LFWKGQYYEKEKQNKTLVDFLQKKTERELFMIKKKESHLRELKHKQEETQWILEKWKKKRERKPRRKTDFKMKDASSVLQLQSKAEFSDDPFGEGFSDTDAPIPNSTNGKSFFPKTKFRRMFRRF